MKFRLLYPVACLALLSMLSIAATPDSPQKNAVTASFFDQIHESSLKNITITLDVDQLLENKNTNDYMSAQLAFAGDQWDINVRPRGRYRRRVCDFPPLRLKFNKDMLEAAGLARHNKFKLVTHCSEDFNSTDNVAREQLAYELFALVNGDGFRTELVQITYRDANTGSETTKLGIIIEDTDEMANHMGGSECDNCMNLATDQFVSNSLEMNSMFQYMIGNADWKVTMQRNVKLVQLHAGGQYIPVPYDFDFAGLVDAEYAKPNPDYNQEKITDRIWVWEYDTAPNIKPVMDRFLEKEQAIMAHIKQFEPLSNRSRKQISNYLQEFFESVKDGSFYTLNNLPS